MFLLEGAYIFKQYFQLILNVAVWFINIPHRREIVGLSANLSELDADEAVNFEHYLLLPLTTKINFLIGLSILNACVILSKAITTC